MFSRVWEVFSARLTRQLDRPKLAESRRAGPKGAHGPGEIFIESLLSRWLGRPPAEPLTLDATISRKVMSPTGDDEYLRVTVGKVGERVIATPLSRGAGVISSLVRADGIVRIPRFSEGVESGQSVTVHLYRHPAEIDRTTVHIGSHDMTLDLLAQFIAERAPGFRLSSANPLSRPEWPLGSTRSTGTSSSTDIRRWTTSGS